MGRTLHVAPGGHVNGRSDLMLNEEEIKTLAT